MAPVVTKRQSHTTMKIALAFAAIMAICVMHVSAQDDVAVIIDTLVITTAVKNGDKYFKADGKFTNLLVKDGYNANFDTNAAGHKIVKLTSGGMTLEIPVPKQPSAESARIIAEYKAKSDERKKAREADRVARAAAREAKRAARRDRG